MCEEWKTTTIRILAFLDYAPSLYYSRYFEFPSVRARLVHILSYPSIYILIRRKMLAADGNAVKALFSTSIAYENLDGAADGHERCCFNGQPYHVLVRFCGIYVQYSSLKDTLFFIRKVFSEGKRSPNLKFGLHKMRSLFRQSSSHNFYVNKKSS